MATSASQTNAVIPPGSFIEEESEARGMNRRELADALNLSVGEVSELIAGNALLTPAIAAELERTLEMPSHMWIRLEAKYRHKLARRGMDGLVPIKG